MRCLLPLASGRFLHLCVLYGYQGADTDAEQFAFTDQLFDAALGELHAVALGQPCLLVGDFNVEPTKIPCLAKGISAGLWVDFGEAWALAAGLHPAPTCERNWTGVGGHRRDFVLGCPLAAAVILSCNVQPDRKRFWGMILWYFWVGRARHPGPTSLPRHFGVEFLNVGGWLTHGDLAPGAGVDFLAVAEHRLIPARVRSEWPRLSEKGLSSVWAPASQGSSHVGNAGVGVVSLRGAPLALPSFSTAQFKSFFCGRAVRCMLPLGAGRFMHLFFFGGGGVIRVLILMLSSFR